MQASRVFMANFDFSLMTLRCRNPLALAGSSHGHVHARGRMNVEEPGTAECAPSRNFSVATYTVAYTTVEATVYAKALWCALDKDNDNIPEMVISFANTLKPLRMDDILI